MLTFSVTLLAMAITGCDAFSTFSMRETQRISGESRTAMCMLDGEDSTDQTDWNTCNRRAFLGVASVATSMLMANPANARDELFRPNLLTNPLLEQLRIWEQAEADNLKYGGELEAGDAGNKGKISAYPRLLFPILKMDQELAEVKVLVRDENRSTSWQKALAILQNEKYDKIAFKKTFNAYSDNIYYGDADRANLYLGGGATPKNEQSLAYLLRNDMLTNIENLRAELEYLLKDGEDGIDDLYSYTDIVTGAMKKYLAFVPPNELEEARKILDGN